MKKNLIGFSAKNASVMQNNDQVLHNTQTDDLIKFGLIPELIGRFPVVGILDDLDDNHLFQILTEPKNAITKQYQALFKLDGINLEFKEDALRQITREAVARKVGARGLRAIFEEIMLDMMFELPSKKNKALDVVVDFDYLKEKKWIA